MGVCFYGSLKLENNPFKLALTEFTMGFLKGHWRAVTFKCVYGINGMKFWGLYEL